MSHLLLQLSTVHWLLSYLIYTIWTLMDLVHVVLNPYLCICISAMRCIRAQTSCACFVYSRSLKAFLINIFFFILIFKF